MNLVHRIDKDDPFTRKIFLRLWKPALISSAGLAFSDMADAFFVGRTTGEVGLAAIAICLPLYMIINIFMYGLGVGGANKYSTLRSEGKNQEGKACYNHVIQGSIVIGLLIALIGNLIMEGLITLLGAGADNMPVHTAAVTYGRLILGAAPFFMLSHIIYYLLSSDNREKEANICFAVACCFDIFLNLFFVSVLKLGTFGAGLSTMTGQIVACILYMIIVFKNRDSVPFTPFIKPDAKEVIICFRNGFSTSIGFLWQIFYFSIVNHVLMRKIGQNGVAAFDILQNISYLFMYIYEAVVKAMEPVVSTYAGERNKKGQRNALFVGMEYGNRICILFILLVGVIPGGISHAFGITSAEGVRITEHALRVYCVGALFMGMSTILEGYEQAKGNERNAYFLTTLRGALILFPMIIIFGVVGNSNSFWWAFPIVEISSFAIYQIIVNILFRRKTEDSSDTEVYNKIIDSAGEDYASVFSDIEEYCDSHDATPKQSMMVNMAVEEAISAIINFAFKDNPEGYIAITLFKNEDFFELHIRDSAIKFDLFSMNTGAVSLDTEEDDDIMGSIGIHMIKKKVRTFSYRHHQGFNTLVITV